MGWIRFKSHSWQSVPMPHGSAPVELARLPLTGHDFLAFVRFPAGWVRPVPVVYQAAEEFVIIDGELVIDGQRWAAQSYGCIDSGVIRHRTESPSGCLAWARFHGSPRVSRVDVTSPGTPVRSAGGTLVDLDRRDLASSSKPGPHLLRELPGGSSWWYPQFDEHARAERPGAIDALALNDLSWWSGDPDSDAAPPMIGAAVVHHTSELSR